VSWMVIGSVPMAFLGAYLLHLMGQASAAENNIQTALGAALLVGAAAMVLRYGLDRWRGHGRGGPIHGVRVRPVPTIIIGMVGGIIVGMTSVGSGSLMIVLLLLGLLGATGILGDTMKTIADWSPVGALMTLFSDVLNHSPWKGQDTYSLLACVGYSFVFAFIGIRWFRWNAR